MKNATVINISEHTDITPDDLCIIWKNEVVRCEGRSGTDDVLEGTLSLMFGSGTASQRGKARGQITRGIRATEAQVVTVTHVMERTPVNHPLFEARFSIVVKHAIRRGDLV